MPSYMVVPRPTWRVTAANVYKLGKIALEEAVMKPAPALLANDCLR